MVVSLFRLFQVTSASLQALFSWKYEPEVHGEATDCIPRQLQALFARLALTNRGAVDTVALTKSFGWTQSDSFKAGVAMTRSSMSSIVIMRFAVQQHDVQELMRVLFTALEEKLSATVINDIYQARSLTIAFCLFVYHCGICVDCRAN